MILLINNNGKVITRLSNIFEIKISFISIGELFKIHKLLPSNDIVGYVVQDKAQNKLNIMGKDLLSISLKLGIDNRLPKLLGPAITKKIEAKVNKIMPIEVFNKYKVLEKYFLSSFLNNDNLIERTLFFF